MVAPIMFGGYGNGDAGTVYPNSPSMLNCRNTEKGGVEEIDGYGNFITGLSALSGSGAGFLSPATLVGMYEYNYSGIDTYIRQGQIFVYQRKASTPFVRWELGAVKSDWNLFNMGAMDGDLGPSGTAAIRFNMFMNNILATYSIPYAGSGMVYHDVLLSAGYFAPLSACPINPAFTEVHYNRVFAGGDWTKKSTINWSDVDTIHTWAGTSTLNVNTDDGDFGTGIKSYAGDLYFFKSKYSYKISGNDFNVTSGNYYVTKLEGVPGAVCQGAICVAGGNMYWVSQSHVVEWNGSSFQYIDYPYLKLDIDATTYNYGTTEAEPFLLVSNEKNNEIIFTKRDTAIWWTYNYVTRKWAKISLTDSSLVATSILQHLDITNGKVNPAFCSPTGQNHLFNDSRTFLNSTGTAIGINSYYETDWMDLGNEKRKDGTRIILEMKKDGLLSAHAYALSCSTYYDYDPVAYSSNVITVDGGNYNQFYDIYPQVQTHRRIKLKFANNVIDTKMQINRAMIEYNLVDESGRL